MPATIYEAPELIKQTIPRQPMIFLSGAIDQGKAEEWQSRVIRVLADEEVILLNPRRLDWDDTWQQTIHNPQFCEQVIWELNGLERADLVLMWFPAESTAPITLFELGLLARTGRLVVGCAPGYWRRGNVEVVCDRYDVRLEETLDELIKDATRWIQRWNLIRG